MAASGRPLIFDTPEKRQQLHRQYCEHLQNGYLRKDFPHCPRQTLAHYIERHPDDFPEDEIQMAESAGAMKLQQIGVDQALGKISGNATSWIFLMKNVCGWSDRKQISGPEGGPIPVFNMDPSSFNEEELEVVKRAIGILKSKRPESGEADV